jgi:hypothetical protein
MFNDADFYERETRTRKQTNKKKSKWLIKAYEDFIK